MNSFLSRGRVTALAALTCIGVAAPVIAQDLTEIEQYVADATPEDLATGKEVYAEAGCRECHGWDGNGMGMRDHRPTGAHLRDSLLDPIALWDIISCGIPGTAMPSHDQMAYRDDRCYGMTFDNTDTSQIPNRSNNVRKADREALVAYLMAEVIDKGPATMADCVAYFGEGDSYCEDNAAMLAEE